MIEVGKVYRFDVLPMYRDGGRLAHLITGEVLEVVDGEARVKLTEESRFSPRAEVGEVLRVSLAMASAQEV